MVDPDDLALAQARLANAEAQIAAAQAALQGVELRAPSSGTVVELDALVGKTLLAGQQALLLADLSELYVETTDLTELDVVRIGEGEQATITPDALEDLRLHFAGIDDMAFRLHELVCGHALGVLVLPTRRPAATN